MSSYEAMVNYCGSSGCAHNYLNKCAIRGEVKINSGVCESYIELASHPSCRRCEACKNAPWLRDVYTYLCSLTTQEEKGE